MERAGRRRGCSDIASQPCFPRSLPEARRAPSANAVPSVDHLCRPGHYIRHLVCAMHIAAPMVEKALPAKQWLVTQRADGWWTMRRSIPWMLVAGLLLMIAGGILLTGRSPDATRHIDYSRQHYLTIADATMDPLTSPTGSSLIDGAVSQSEPQGLLLPLTHVTFRPGALAVLRLSWGAFEGGARHAIHHGEVTWTRVDNTSEQGSIPFRFMSNSTTYLFLGRKQQPGPGPVTVRIHIKGKPKHDLMYTLRGCDQLDVNRGFYRRFFPPKQSVIGS